MAQIVFGDSIMGEVVDGKLILEIDLDHNYGPSSSGKTLKVASTGGFVKIPGVDGVIVSVNVNRRN